jgi:hypothetical protein
LTITNRHEIKYIDNDLDKKLKQVVFNLTLLNGS